MSDSKGVRVGVLLLFAAGALMFAWVAARWLLGLYVDGLWFAAAGYGSVFRTMLGFRVGLGAIVFLVSASVLVVNVRLAYRRTVLQETGLLAGSGLEPRRADALIRVVFHVAALFVGLLLACSVARNWVEFANFRYAVPFDIADPVFQKDAGFYVFRLPAIAYTAKTLFMMLVLCLALTSGVYWVRGSIALAESGSMLKPEAFRHVSILGGLAAAFFAVRFWTLRYQVLVSKRGVVFGAGYADIHAQLGAYSFLLVAALALAGWLIVNASVGKRPGNLYAVGLFVVLWVAVGFGYPFCVQTFVVRPNELEYEKEYVERSISFTRRAYGLDNVTVRPWPGDGALSAGVLASHPDTVDNLLIWDPEPLRDVYNQKQRMRSYYTFGDMDPQRGVNVPVDVDRYDVDGRLRPVMIAPRELAAPGLPEKSRVWTNLHLKYTHGYGLCMSFGNRAAGGGLPEFLIRDIPPVADPGFQVSQPRVYYGEQTRLYALTHTKLDEFDYPGDPENFSNRYAGEGGFPVGGRFRRALLSWHTGDKDLLFTEQFTEESRILMFRHVRQRAMKLAPFLSYDEDPYPVLHEGRIVWIVDGYTTTRRFPYSERLGMANYWRNSVKVTVDAYDGTVTFYRTDDADPILAVFDRLFPGLFRPLTDMPPGLRGHLRYPKDLFRVQTAVYRRYHVDDPQVFFLGEDVWTFPRVTSGEQVSWEDPRYLVMELPDGGGAAEFVVTRAFTVEGKDNMVGWLAGRCDGEHYGELVLLRLPKHRNIYGPSQAKGRFNQHPEVSQFTTLMGQLGSTVIQSKVLVVPIEQGLLYVQSLFVEDPEVKIPELKRIVVGHGDQVAMAPTIGEALSKLFGDVPEGLAASFPDSAGAYERARDLYERAQERLREGDWAGFGAAFEELGRTLAGPQ
jgi:uncharacterized protein